MALFSDDTGLKRDGYGSRSVVINCKMPKLAVMPEKKLAQQHQK